MHASAIRVVSLSHPRLGTTPLPAEIHAICPPKTLISLWKLGPCTCVLMENTNTAKILDFRTDGFCPGTRRHTRPPPPRAHPSHRHNEEYTYGESTSRRQHPPSCTGTHAGVAAITNSCWCGAESSRLASSANVVFFGVAQLWCVHRPGGVVCDSVEANQGMLHEGWVPSASKPTACVLVASRMLPMLHHRDASHLGQMVCASRKRSY